VIVKISSVHNKKVLSLRKLYKSRERKLSDVFIVEGIKEVQRGLDSGLEIQSLFFCPKIFTDNIEDVIKKYDIRCSIFELDEKVYEKLAYRGNTEGLLAVFKKKNYNLDELIVKENDLFIILESVEKPGNLGAVLRTADAAGVTAILLTESKVDQYHPNVIRSSIGAVFNIPVIVSTNNAVFDWLNSKKISFYSAALPSYQSLYSLDLQSKTALVFGTESDGLSDFWLKENKRTFTIPMSGIVDSLNVSVSVAVAVYETVRQRVNK